LLRSICVIAAFATLAGCQSSLPTPPAYMPADFQLSEADAAALETQRILARGSNAAGVEIYLDLLAQQRLNGGVKNVFISPASIFTAFGLLYAGADGSTAEEISRVMHFSHPDTGFHEAMGAFEKKLERSDGDALLAFSNAVWLDRTTVVEEPYFPRVAPYGAGDHRVDFQNDPQGARRTINAWVEEKTRDRIKELLKPPHVMSHTRSVLVNAIYMKMPWYDAFELEWTAAEPFRFGDGTSAPTPMMHTIDWFPYFDGPGFKLAALPYKQGGEDGRHAGISMVILLPDDPRGLAKLESQLTPSALESWLGQLPKDGSTRLDLKLPKLKIEQTYDELEETLKRLGMTETFSASANLERLAKPERQPDGNGLGVSKVIHKTFIEVDEKGTEAAAATAIVTVVITGSGGPAPPPPIPFFVDHPFLFFIRDDETGAILFMGRVVDPRTEAR
jgi:serpin B